VIKHTQLSLPPFARGYHLVTDLILNQIDGFPDQGIMHVFIKHTSAAISINENADPSVLVDFESIFNHLVPEHLPFLRHTVEGPDDMPAHIKAAMIGSSISIPIVNGQLDLGIWQGIYLCEFRNHASSRQITITVYS